MEGTLANGLCERKDTAVKTLWLFGTDIPNICQSKLADPSCLIPAVLETN